MSEEQTAYHPHLRPGPDWSTEFADGTREDCEDCKSYIFEQWCWGKC